tara:strand:+ start:1124 stop:3232 length:2109 start_codon:yes stop_codon:yes gene_type:complete
MKIEKSTEDKLGKSISNLFSGITKRVDTSVKEKLKEKKPVETVKTFVSNNNPLKTIPKAISEKKTEVVEGIKKSKNAYKTAAFAPPPRVVGEGYKDPIGPKQLKQPTLPLPTSKKKITIDEEAKAFMKKRSITPNPTPKIQNMKNPPWLPMITNKIDGVKKAIKDIPSTGESATPKNKVVDKVEKVKPKEETVTRESMLTTLAKSIGGIRRSMTERGRAENKEKKLQRKEDKKSAKEERSLRIKEDKKNLRDNIKQQRKDAKKARFDKGNPLQRISKFQLEAKKARASGAFKTRKWRDRTRKENQMFVYSKITGIVKTLAKVLIATLVIGLILKVVGKTLNFVKKIKEFLFGKRKSTETTDAEQKGLGKGSTIDNKKILNNDELDKTEKSIAVANNFRTKNKASNFIKEGIRDGIGRSLNVTGASLSKVADLGSKVPLVNKIPTIKLLDNVGKGISSLGATTLSATSFQGKDVGRAKDGMINDITEKRIREQIEKSGDKDKLKEFDDALDEAKKKNRADEKRLKRIAKGEKLRDKDLKNLDKGEAEMYKGLTAEDAKKQLEMFKQTNGKFKGDGSRDLNRIVEKLTGKTFDEQKGSVLSDFIKSNPDFLEGSSGDSSSVAAEFKEGSNWSKSQEQRNALLQEIKTAIVSAQQGMTVNDYSNNDNSTNNGGSGGGTTKEYIGNGPSSEDADAIKEFGPASVIG